MDKPVSLFAEFMPHGMCYVWDPAILWLNVISDLVIAVSYFFIPVALFYFLRQRRDIPFRGVLYMFTLFILACGVTHSMGVWTVWHGHYGIHGIFKALTAMVSMGCAAMLVPVMPKLLALRSQEELELANKSLETEIKARKQTEARALQILESSPDGRIIMDADGLIESVNARGEELFGYAGQELVGKPIQMLIRGEFDEHLSNKDFPLTPIQFAANKKNGEVFPVEVSLSPISGAEKSQISAAVRDISDRISKEIKTQELQRNLAHLSRLRTVGELATGLAHELNQPLTAIVQNLDTAKLALQDTDLAHTEIPELFSEIETCAHRSSEIIRALRRFVRNENTEKSTIDINDLIRTTIQLVEPEAAANLIEIKTKLSQVDQPKIDPTQIAQVLVNLLRNAIEAISATDNERREIVVETHQATPKAVAISVTDSGPGVDPDLNLFEPFQSGKENGMGIGLSISRSIIEAHGGTLTTEASGTSGARFSFDLPLGESHER